jgi:hypothetical protein
MHSFALTLLLAMTDVAPTATDATTVSVPPISASPSEQTPVAIDVWGWKAGMPDTAPPGRYLEGELRFLRGFANLDDRNPDAALGRNSAPRIEYGVRNGENLGGAVALGILHAEGTGDDGARRRFEAANLDFDLLIGEIRPMRLLRMNFRVGVGAAWFSYRRQGGGDPNASLIPTYSDAGPLLGVAAGAIGAVLSSASDSQINATVTEDPEPEPTGATVDPRSQEDFGRRFAGALVHVGTDQTLVLGRSGTALFTAGDVRGVAGVRDSAMGASGRAGLRGFRKVGRYRVQVAAGYSIEYWRFNVAGFGSDSLASFYFHGPFAQAEVRF